MLDFERLRHHAAIKTLQRAAASVTRRWRRPWVGVGLDLDAASVKAVAVRHEERRHVLLAAVVEAVEDPAAGMADAIRRVWSESGIASLKAPFVTTAVSGSGVVVRFATFPRMTAAQLKQAVQFEAEKHIPYQLSEVVLDFHAVEPDTQEAREVLLVAAKKTLVQEHLTLLQGAAVIPHVVDLEAFALANAWEASGRSSTPATVTALMGVEPQRTVVNLLTGTRLRLTREFPTGGSGEAPGAAAPIVEHLVRQARLSFDFFENQHGQGVERVVLSGPAVRWSGFAELLQEALGVPVERWDPVRELPRGAQVDGGRLETISADLTVAWGLSLRRPG